MPKQLNVNLAFTADTSQAKRELQALQQELKKLAVDSLGDSSLGKYTKELQVARDAAVDLRNKLAEATDVNTGKLDLSKFSQSLKNGGMDLKEYQAQLANLGPAGDKAFASVANAILKAELPLKRTSGLLEQFKTTLMNTARWQISSNILHGFQGALQTAWHYAQDLNESLNNIQIVTQQSNEQMAQFAINANKAAHELSASTTTYTDAALIYYQQGLNDEQVKQRTDVTVKLANVTGDSASKVSEQMTAIWNNFDDGTKSLEHYADVLTALGAATASSSDEIAGGMQQFAASASTVGLSYEYAASALATVVATTRQSENVVGNAFKTLFARLEGLNLGETLDDGTTLNKYSAALDKVGISIKDQQGNMKAMDDILDELGAKWGTLAKDQQVALAQTVGGVRQYTQLIALMDNWGEFQKNLSIANKSDGSLQEQADIYADSWQAAQKRVQTSLEEIYHDLIDDKAFIKVLDFIDNIIQGVDAIIKGVGGLKGVLSGVGALLLNVFGKELTQGLNNLAYNFNIKAIQQQAIDQKKEAAAAMKTFGASNADVIVGGTTNDIYQQRGELQEAYLMNYERLTDEQRKQVQLALDLNAAQGDYLIGLAKEVSQQEEAVRVAERKARSAVRNVKGLTSGDLAQFEEDNKTIGAVRAQFTDLKNAFENGTIAEAEYKKGLQDIKKQLLELYDASDDNVDLLHSEAFKDSVTTTIDAIDTLDAKLNATDKAIDVKTARFEEIRKVTETTTKKMGDLSSTAVDNEYFANPNLKAAREDLLEYGNAAQIGGEKLTHLQNGQDGAKQGTDQLKNSITNLQKPLMTTNELIVASAQGVSTFIFALQSISGIIDTINSKDMSDGEKVVAVIGSLAMLIPTIMRSYQGLNTVIAQYNARQTAQAALAAATTAAEKKKAEAMLEANTAAAAFNPVLAGIMVAVGAIVLAYKIWTAHLEKHREEVQKHIDQQQEEINKKKELINANTELVASLTKLENKYDSVGNATSEYISQLSKLIDTYDIEDGRLKLLQKDYAGAEKAIYSKIKADKEAAIANAESANRYLQENNFNEDTGLFGSYLSEKSYNTSDNTFWEKLGHAAANANVSQNGPNLQAQQAIDDSYKNDWNNLKGSTQAAQDAIDTLHELNFINEQGANFSQVTVNNYSKVAEALTTLKQAGVSMAEDPLNDLNTFMASDNYKTFIENAKLIHSEKLSSAFIDPADTKNLTDFSGAVHNLLQDAQENYSLAEIISAASEAGNQWADDYMALSEKFGDALDDNILKKYQSMSKEQRTLFLLADIDPKSLAQTDQAIADYIKSHKADTLQIKLELITEAADTWKENMSAGEINAWYEQYKDLFASEAEWREFLFKDFGDQQDWLGERITETKPEVVKAINDEIAAMRERAAEMDKNGHGLTEDAQKAKDDAIRLEEEKLREEHNGSREIAAEKEAQLQAIYEKYPEVMPGVRDAYAELNQKIAENEALNRTEMDLLAANAESFEQLEEWLQNGTIDTKAFNSGLEKLYNQLDEDVDKEEWEDLAKFLQKNAKELKGVSEELTTNEKAAKKVASAILRFDDAIQDVSEHYDDWMDALENGTAQDQAKAASEMADAYADLLDLPFDTLSGDFLQNTHNLELMKEAAEGSEDAYKELQGAVREDILAHVAIDRSQWEDEYNTLMTQYDAMNQLDGIQVGASIDDAGFLAACEEMINAAGMTADQATNFLASMGVDAEVEKVPVTETYTGTTYSQRVRLVPQEAHGLNQSTQVPFSERVDSIYVDNFPQTYTEKKETGAFALKVTSAKKSSGGGFKYNNASHGGGGGGSKGGGGGGGSAPKHQTVKAQSHANIKPPEQSGERYHVINNQIEDLAKQYDRLSEAEERAFGKSKLALMDKQVEKLKEQHAAQRKLREEAQKYWKQDMEALRNAEKDTDGDGKVDTLGAAKYLGTDIDFDKNGTIKNYDDLVAGADARYNNFINSYNAFIDSYNAAIDKYNNMSAEEQEAAKDQWAAEQEEWEKQKETWDERQKEEETYYDNFMGLIDQYEETQDKVQEEFNKEIEAYHAVLDKLLEKTEYTVQLKVDVADDALRIIDFLQSTAYNSPWAAASNIAATGEKFGLTEDKINANRKGLAGIFQNHFNIDHVFDNNNLDTQTNEFKEQMEALGYKTGEQIVQGLEAGDQALMELLGNMENEFTENEVESWREKMDNMLSETENLWKAREDIFKFMDEYIESASENLDNMADHMDHLANVASKYRDIMDIVGHNKGGFDTATLKAMTDAQQALRHDALRSAKARNDFAQHNLETAKQAKEDLINSGKATARDIELWDEEIQKLQEKADSAREELLDDLHETLQGALDQFNETITLMAEDASKAMGGVAGSLEGLQTQMDQYEKTHSTFVPEYERMYQLNKLNAEAIKAIDETNNIKAKQELLKYQKQINEALESGQEMSEWELQNLEKELALRQAALAVEEATSVKSQVRMSRDNEGNYSYIYTADESAVDDAQANYRDKLYEMQKANAEYINQLQRDITALEQEYLSAIQEAANLYGVGSDEYYQALDRINEWYGKAVDDKYNQLSMVMEANIGLQEFDKNFHAQMTQDKMVSDQGYVTNFDQTTMSQITGYKNIEDASGQWADAVQRFNTETEGSTNNVRNAVNQYAEDTKTAMGEGGIPTSVGESQTAWQDFARYLIGGGEDEKGALQRLQEESNKLAGDTETLAQTYDTAINGEKGIIPQVEAWEEDYSPRIDNMINKNTTLAETLGDVIENLAGIKEQNPLEVDVSYNVPELKLPDPDPIVVDIQYNDPGWSAPNVSVDSSPSGSGGGGTGDAGGSPTGGGGDGSKYIDHFDKNVNGHTPVYKWTNNPSREERGLTSPHNFNMAGVCKSCGYVKRDIKKDATARTAYATGGYTGDWGSNEGKLAVLHEKELVLNKDDTANMLSAVNMIRQISSVIDLNAKSAGGAFSQLFAASVNTGAQELQQDVHITAEFPNATDKNEILAAFDNVINLASQYANRKTASIRDNTAVKF